MADAGPAGAAVDVRRRVRGPGQERRHAFRSGSGMEGHDLRGSRDWKRDGVRRILWAIWAERAARSDDRADGTEAGFLLPVAVCAAGVPAAGDGNAGAVDW